MDYVQLTLDDYIQCKTEIKENLMGIVKSFVKIGWQLTRINASKAYTLDGYSSITEFAKVEYDMNPDGVSRFMSVYERYSVPGDTPELQERYRDFKFAQLSEMLQLTEEDQHLITPDTKRADIRELKKFNKENENNPDQLLNWKNGEENKIYKTIYELFKGSKEELNELFGSDAYRTGSLEQMVDIVNPSGSRSYRKETVFLMMYGPEKGIMVKQIPQGTSNMSWSEFFNIVQDLFGEKAAGNRTWEAYFGVEDQKVAESIKTSSDSEDVEPSAEIAPAQTTEETEEKRQKTAPDLENTVVENVKTDVENAGENENIVETTSEEQIPGQDSILNHEEYMPQPIPEPEKPEPQKEPEPQENTELQKHPEITITEPVPIPEKTEEPKEDVPPENTPSAGIAPAQNEVVEKPKRRKEYLDGLTEYGAADYLASTFRGFGNITFSQLTKTNFWLDWMDGLVDHNGRPWVD